MKAKSLALDTFRELIAKRDASRRSNQKRLRNVSVGTTGRNDLLPNLTLADRDPRELSAPTRNVRGRDTAHVRAVANSISALGFVAPILIDENNKIIDGVIRKDAAELLGLPTVPCVIVNARTETERRMARLAANRLGERGTWVLEDLQVELEELIVEDVSIEVCGFEPAEIDGILTEVEEDSLEPGPLEPESEKPAVARIGDVFRLGSHRLICGDARDPAVLARLMKTEQARFVLTDPPFNVPIAGHVSRGAHREFAMASGEMTEEQFYAFNETWIALAARYSVDGGLLASFIDWRGLCSVTVAAAAAGLSQINLIVWSKTNAGMGSLYRSQHELVPYFKKGDAPHVNNVDLGRHGRWRSNQWVYAGASSVGSDARRGLQYHPTVKPKAMLVDALLDVTNRGDVVLDPFLGSGSTLIAADQTGRICRGVEIDPIYVDLILRRFREFTGTEPVLEETGETFSDLTRRRRDEKRAAESPSEQPMTKPLCRTRTR